MDSRRETVKSCGVCEFASCDTITLLFAPCCSASVAANIFSPALSFRRTYPHVGMTINTFPLPSPPLLSRGLQFFNASFAFHVFISSAASTRALSRFRETESHLREKNDFCGNTDTFTQLYSNWQNKIIFLLYCHFITSNELHCTTLLKRDVIRLETKPRPDSRFNFT